MVTLTGSLRRLFRLGRLLLKSLIKLLVFVKIWVICFLKPLLLAGLKVLPREVAAPEFLRSFLLCFGFAHETSSSCLGSWGEGWTSLFLWGLPLPSLMLDACNGIVRVCSLAFEPHPI